MPNRWKRKTLREKAEAREGLTPKQVAELDVQEALEEKIQKQAKKLHREMFPEEYDCVFDSYVDSEERSRGFNPMSQEYIDKIAEKRRDLGVSPLSECGCATSDDTYQLCLDLSGKDTQRHSNFV